MAPFGFCLSKETRLSCCHHEEIKIKQACKHGDFFFFFFFFLFSIFRVVYSKAWNINK